MAWNGVRDRACTLGALLAERMRHCDGPVLGGRRSASERDAEARGEDERFGRLSVSLPFTLAGARSRVACAGGLSMCLGGKVRRVFFCDDASRSRREVNCERNSGSARSGFAEILSSSKQLHAARAGDSDAKKFAEMSSASNDVLMRGSVAVKNDGTELGVLEPPTRRCVVPETNFREHQHKKDY